MASRLPGIRGIMSAPSFVARRSQGFTYLGLIIMLAVMAIFTVSSLQLGSIMTRRAAEHELLAIGGEFRDALASYAAATPEGQASLPQSLQDLLKDARYPATRRHLRKLYADPITGKEEWGTVTAATGATDSGASGGNGGAGSGIIGVYSLSEGTPIKTGNFDPPFQDFEGAKSYREWQFIFKASAEPSASPAQPAPAPAESSGRQSVTRAVTMPLASPKIK
jgi:type II secretory pathway pseudopilin PulG